MSDLALRGRIIEALADAPHVDVAEIAVECHDDRDVVLRGSVVNLLQRAEAVRTARGVPGVRAVDDQMRTRPEGAEHRADAETEAAVLDALILDDAVPAYGIDVDVDGGRVTLCGAVDIASQPDAAERIALRVPGVTEVHNRLKVWTAVSAQDVAERIANATVDPDEITVTVRDNVVTLTGSVRSRDDRDAAVAAAARAPGLVGVRDKVRVVPDGTLAYANRAGSELWGSTRPSWLREVMSSLVKHLRRW